MPHIPTSFTTRDGRVIDLTVPTADNVGMMPVGAVLPDGGVVLAVTLTAYHVRPHGIDLDRARQGGEACVFVPFSAVHPRGEAVTPLVTFGGG